VGERGPQKKPTALRLLHGDEARTINGAEPDFEKGAPDFPGDLPEYAREFLTRVVPDLERIGMLAKVDAAALETTARLYAATRDAWEEYGGVVSVKGATGAMVTNPALVAYRTLARELRGYLHEFGFTPASRAGLVAPGATDDGDELARIIG
jgi:P27 family predicted phage terminase small subunit